MGPVWFVQWVIREYNTNIHTVDFCWKLEILPIGFFYFFFLHFKLSVGTWISGGGVGRGIMHCSWKGTHAIRWIGNLPVHQSPITPCCFKLLCSLLLPTYLLGHVSPLTQSVLVSTYVSGEVFSILSSCQAEKKLVWGLCLTRVGWGKRLTVSRSLCRVDSLVVNFVSESAIDPCLP